LIVESQSFDSIHVVLGSAYQSYEKVKTTFGNSSEIYLHYALTADQMFRVMNSCSFAILPASTILYEATALRIPTISGYYIDNQKRIFEGFKSKDLIIPIGDMTTAKDLTYSIRFLFQKAEKLRENQAQQLSFDILENNRSLFSRLS
jgi:spore coat polysaccharide biosynthesis predicted glycosyltransferase SpsG